MQAALSSALFPAPSPSSHGARLVTADGRELSFRGATVHVRAQGGTAVVVLTQRFANPYAEPLSVRYTMPLPADAAVRGYSFLIGARLVRGQVDRKRAARERFARAVAAGQTAGLVEQERSSVFTQELGNIPPGEELVAMLELDQPLAWLDEGSWEWRFPTVVAPRYLGAEGRVADAGKVTVDVAARSPASGPRVELVLHVLDRIEGEISSPTHALATRSGEGIEVNLAASARLDRDIAVRWPVAQPRVGLSLQAARPEATSARQAQAYGLLTVVPPSPRSRPRATPRDLILLVDASGSMYGAPMNQARQLMRALVSSLEDHDRLEMISFGDRPHRWKRGATEASASGKREALSWIDRLQAEGGTEMRSGILEALNPLRADAQRQVVLITDGLIGFESEIVATLHDKLPAGCRLHTVGVGSGINRSLTGPAARAGRGVEVILDLDGDPSEATRRLLSRTCAPLVTDLVLEGDALVEHAPARLPDLFAGAPVLLSLQLRPTGGTVRLRGRTPDGPWQDEVQVAALSPGEGSPSIPALFGRERVEDLEALWAIGRDQSKIDQQIEQTGLDYQIATRLTSWVAVTEHRTVDPEAPKRSQNTPQELPYGMSAEGLGLRPAAPAPGALPASLAQHATRAGVVFSLKHAADDYEEEEHEEEEQEEDEEVEEADKSSEREFTRSAPMAMPQGKGAAAPPSQKKEERRSSVSALLGKVSSPAPAPKAPSPLAGGRARRFESDDAPAPPSMAPGAPSPAPDYAMPPSIASEDRLKSLPQPAPLPSASLMLSPERAPQGVAPRSNRPRWQMWLFLLVLLALAVGFWFFLGR